MNCTSQHLGKQTLFSNKSKHEGCKVQNCFFFRCTDYKKGICTDVLCPKWHNYMFCKNYANHLFCEKDNRCPYMHLTIAEQVLYQRGSRGIENIVGSEALRTFQVN